MSVSESMIKADLDMAQWAHDYMLSMVRKAKVQNCRVETQFSTASQEDRLKAATYEYLESGGLWVILLSGLAIRQVVHMPISATFKLMGRVRVDVIRTLSFVVKEQGKAHSLYYTTNSCKLGDDLRSGLREVGFEEELFQLLDGPELCGWSKDWSTYSFYLNLTLEVGFAWTEGGVEFWTAPKSVGAAPKKLQHLEPHQIIKLPGLPGA